MLSGDDMNFHIEYEQEDDGRWLAEIPEIPGVLTYGATANEAMAKLRYWHFAHLPNALKQKKVSPCQSALTLLQREPLAFGKSQACSCSTTGYRLES